MKHICLAAAAATSLAFAAAPAAAQEEEESRTTWRIMAIDVADGSGARWEEIIMQHILPAYEAAGLPVPQLHWTMASQDWDFVVIEEMPGGMATFDTHAPPSRMALFEALVAQEGSEEAVEALFDELDAIETETTVLYTHSHP